MHIIVHSVSNCAYCEKAKDYLKSKNLKYEEISYDKSTDTDKIMNLVENTNWSTFPQIFIDGLFIGGYMQLLEYEFDESGEIIF